MGLILALDQGATKTAALVATMDGEIRGVGYGRGAVHASDGMAAAMAAVQEASAAALGQAGASLSQVDLVFGGMSGADWPHEYPVLEGALRQATGTPRVMVVNDCMIARRAGTDSPWGAVLCAGTGLNAAVISLSGEQYIYGYYINGDDHGGTALGRLALRAVFGAESCIAPPTRLTSGFLRRFQVATVDELLQQYVEGQLGPTSTLVPVLTEALHADDAVAQRIVTDFGGRLAHYVTTALKRFDMCGLEQEVVLSGGIFKADLPGLRETVARAILAQAPRARIVDAVYEPVVGALLLAREACGQSASLAGAAEGARLHELVRMARG